ncbi:MAG: metallophosphoesterase family protein [Ignavibacteriales bacterium]|nr:metallophosphoesterase family protein [Ignavibacteriales bacterium]
MRLAILSDIHSNLPALSKALSLVDELHVDEVYCLGDVVGYGGSPNECVDLICQRASKCVLGNHDLASLDTSEARFFTKEGRTAAQWTHDELTKANAEYLSRLPYIIEDDSLTIVHSSPAAPRDWEYVTSLDEASIQFKHFKTTLCFIGHSHIPFLCSEDLKIFSFQKGPRFLINVGSVGQPRDGNPQLSFGFLDTEAWEYENIRADYDINAAAQSIIDNRLPRLLADRLFRGL